MPGPYSVTEEQKKQFASAYLLDRMVRARLEVPVFLEGNDQDLEPVLEYLMARECIAIENSSRYAPTSKGRDILDRFLRRYRDFLAHYDIFCAVDLGEGSFAFERYFDFDQASADGELQWARYLNEERWEDLRVAAVEFKGLNPVEIVFMSFLNEDRFGRGDEGWQFDLLLGSIWDEIVSIADTALSVNDLGYEDDDVAWIDGETVIRDVLTQGAELNMRLKEREGQLYGPAGGSQRARTARLEGEDLETPDGEDGYDAYQRYVDPYYVSPCWGTVVFF